MSREDRQMAIYQGALKSDLDAGAHKITNVAQPTSNSDVANKSYVDAHAGTTNYEQLTNKPQINGVSLVGNKGLSDIGAASESALTSHASNTSNPHGVTAAQVGAAAAVHTHTVENITDFPTPIAPATSAADGAFAAAKETANFVVNNYQTKITVNGVLKGDGSGGISTIAVDNYPTHNSSNLINSGGVYISLAQKQNLINAVGMLKRLTNGVISAAVAGTDYIAPSLAGQTFDLECSDGDFRKVVAKLWKALGGTTVNE